MANLWRVTWQQASGPDGAPVRGMPEGGWTQMTYEGEEATIRRSFELLVQYEAAGMAIRELQLFESDVPVPVLTDRTAEARARVPATPTPVDPAGRR